MACHAPIESIAEGEMGAKIRRLGKRYGDPAGCVVCHGGDPAGEHRKAAHQGAPAALTDAGGPRAFYANPGDVWVAERTCGQCHEGYADRVRKSVQTTQAETVARNLCAPAWRKRVRGEADPRAFGRYAIVDEDGPEPVTGSQQYKHLMGPAVENHPQLYPARLYASPQDIDDRLAEEIPSDCQDCHGDGERPHAGSGCSACHIPYRRDGTYQGKDPTIDRAQRGKLLVHRIQGTGSTRVSLPGEPARAWTGIPLENCFQCHFDPRNVEVSVLGSIHSHYAGHRPETDASLLCQD